MYLTWQANDDPKFNAIRHILEPDAPKDDAGHVELDDGSHLRSQKPDRVEEQPRTPKARPWEFNSLDRANADAHHAPAPTSASGRWDPQSFRDDEQFELDSPYSPGSPDEAIRQRRDARHDHDDGSVSPRGSITSLRHAILAASCNIH